MISLTNQSASATTNKQKDSRIRLKSFLGLPTEDILARLDHFDNVVSYHEWHKERKALELLTVLEHVVASTFIQQPEEIKQNWTYLHEQLMQHFTNNNATQLALWNNGENHGNRDIPLYNLRIQEEIRNYNTLQTECISHTRLLASKLTQLCRRSLTHFLSNVEHFVVFYTMHLHTFVEIALGVYRSMQQDKSQLTYH